MSQYEFVKPSQTNIKPVEIELAIEPGNCAVKANGSPILHIEMLEDANIRLWSFDAMNKPLCIGLLKKCPSSTGWRLV